MDGAFGRYVLILSHRVGLQLFMHRLGCHPCIGQWSLEFRIGLALRLDQPVNLRHKFWLLLFGLVSTTSREPVHATNPRAKFIQSGVHRIPSPPKYLFSSTRMTLAVLDRHFRLKLPSPKPRQLSSRRLDSLLERFRQFFHDGPILEVSIPHDFLDGISLTRNGHFLVDHFLLAAARAAGPSEDAPMTEEDFFRIEDALVVRLPDVPPPGGPVPDPGDGGKHRDPGLGRRRGIDRPESAAPGRGRGLAAEAVRHRPVGRRPVRLCHRHPRPGVSGLVAGADATRAPRAVPPRGLFEAWFSRWVTETTEEPDGGSCLAFFVVWGMLTVIVLVACWVWAVHRICSWRMMFTRMPTTSILGHTRNHRYGPSSVEPAGTPTRLMSKVGQVTPVELVTIASG